MKDIGLEIFGFAVTRLMRELDEVTLLEAVWKRDASQRAMIEVHDPRSPDDLDRGMRSARLGSKVYKTERVLSPVDVGALPDGRLYIVRALCPGALLPDAGALSLSRALVIGREIAVAADTLHQERLSVGRFRSEGIFVESTADGERVRLYDLRWAKELATNPDERRDDTRRCATLLEQIVPPAEITRSLRKLFQHGIDGGFDTCDELATALVEHVAAAREMPNARLLE